MTKKIEDNHEEIKGDSLSSKSVVAKSGKRSAKTAKQLEEKEEKEKKKKTPKKVEEKPKKTSKNIEKAHSKKYKKALESLDKTKVYSLEDAVSLIKKITFAKFDPTIEMHMNLGIDPKQADQNVRGSLIMPKSLGKKVTIAVLADEKLYPKLKEAGADQYNGEDIITKLSKSKIDFDVLISTPDQMVKLGKFAKILGPKGLMPTPKSGTVTDNPVETVKEIKKGRIEFRNDSYGIIHMAVAKASFEDKDILSNIRSAVEAIRGSKPTSIKGSYIKSVYLTSTMSPSIKIDIASF
jgi:large subunit ribosomal protein L1